MRARCEDLRLAAFPRSPSLEEFCKSNWAPPGCLSPWLVATSLPRGGPTLQYSTLSSAGLAGGNYIAGAPDIGAMEEHQISLNVLYG